MSTFSMCSFQLNRHVYSSGFVYHTKQVPVILPCPAHFEIRSEENFSVGTLEEGYFNSGRVLNKLIS